MNVEELDEVLDNELVEPVSCKLEKVLTDELGPVVRLADELADELIDELLDELIDELMDELLETRLAEVVDEPSDEPIA